LAVVVEEDQRRMRMHGGRPRMQLQMGRGIDKHKELVSIKRITHWLLQLLALYASHP
jgi:hypothetical protein